WPRTSRPRARGEGHRGPRRRHQRAVRRAGPRSRPPPRRRRGPRAPSAPPPAVTFERLDARALPFDADFDAVISLCQGAFGLAGGGPAAADTPLDPDGVVLDGIARALRPGGQAAVSAFSAYFQVRWLDPDRMQFDAERGVNHERTVIKDEAGRDAETDLWTTCFTPRALLLLAVRSAL